MRGRKGLWMVIILTVVGVGFSGERERFSKKEYKEYLESIRRAAKEINGNFLLEGIVVDEKGKPLKDVQMDITTLYSASFFEEKEWKERKVIDGSFRIKVRNRADVYLEFSKEGYYDERLHFSFDPPEGGKREGRTLVNRNIKVVLERIGELPKLIKFESDLVYYSSRKAIIINFDNLGGPGTVVGTRGRERVEDLLFAIEGGTLPPNSIYILPRIDARGKVIPVIDEYNRYFAPPTKLVMNDPEGGFVVVDPKNLKGKGSTWRKMKEAPEEGYVREITLDYKSDTIYFYFKTGNKYGKGLIGSVVYFKKSRKEKVDGVLGFVKLWLNPTGERNVRTRSFF